MFWLFWRRQFASRLGGVLRSLYEKTSCRAPAGQPASAAKQYTHLNTQPWGGARLNTRTGDRRHLTLARGLFAQQFRV